LILASQLVTLPLVILLIFFKVNFGDSPWQKTALGVASMGGTALVVWLWLRNRTAPRREAFAGFRTATAEMPLIVLGTAGQMILHVAAVLRMATYWPWYRQ